MSDITSPSHPRTIEDVREILHCYDCCLVSSEYENSRTTLQVLCNCFQIYETSLKKFFKRPRCLECHNSLKNQLASIPDGQTASGYSERMRNIPKRMYKNQYNSRYQYIKDYKNLGYGPGALRDRIHKHPNFAQVYDFSLDHIYPISAFLRYGIYDPKIINALTNLQPMNANENHIKSGVYDLNSFKSYVVRNYRSNFKFV